MPRHLYQAPALLGQLLMPLVQAAGGHIGPATRRQVAGMSAVATDRHAAGGPGWTV